MCVCVCMYILYLYHIFILYYIILYYTIYIYTLPQRGQDQFEYPSESSPMKFQEQNNRLCSDLALQLVVYPVKLHSMYI